MTARKFFDDHKDGLLDSYSHALAGDSTMRDAMIVRVRVLPNGNVDAASVRTSTDPNPAFDAEIIHDVSAWNFPPFSGSDVEIDYPIIFTNDPSTKDALESALSTKLAGLSPTEAPELASSPPSPEASAAASEAMSPPSPAAVGDAADGGRHASATAATQASCAATAQASRPYLAAAGAAGALVESADAARELLHQRQHRDDFRQGIR